MSAWNRPRRSKPSPWPKKPSQTQTTIICRSWQVLLLSRSGHRLCQPAVQRKDLAGMQDKIAKIEFQVKSAPDKLIHEHLRLPVTLEFTGQTGAAEY